MSKRSKTILLSLGVIIMIVGVASVVAQNVPWDVNDPEFEKLEQAAREGRISSEAWDALWNAREQKEEWKSLSAEEKTRIKKELHQEYLQAREERERTAEELPSPKMGIIEKGVDPIKGGTEFRQTRPAWRGNVGGSLFTVVAGANYPDPLQGVVIVMDGVFDPLDFRTHPTPTATGPVRIVSEQDGVIVLESVEGEYEVYDIDTDTRENVSAPGDETYHFDMKTRTFLE